MMRKKLRVHKTRLIHVTLHNAERNKLTSLISTMSRGRWFQSLDVRGMNELKKALVIQLMTPTLRV